MKRGVVLPALLFLLLGCGRQDAPPPGGDNNNEPETTSPRAGDPPSPPAGGSPSPDFDGRLIRVTVRGRNVSPAPRSVDARLGQRVRVEVTADTSDELHVHGYDLRENVRPGEPAAVEFDATIPGSFEVELERAGLKLLDLRVR